MRTIVFSDVHGEPELIRRVLDHSAYRPGDDRLIFAGDAIEVGRDSAGCLDLLAEIGAECLVGNHEYAAFVGRVKHEHRMLTRKPSRKKRLGNPCPRNRVYGAGRVAYDRRSQTVELSAIDQATARQPDRFVTSGRAAQRV